MTLNSSLISANKNYALMVLGCIASVTHSAAQQSPKPNIILILVDDMGFSDLGCYGSEIRTPNLDSLSERGLRFNQFYNGARSCPTRASLLTGLYAHQSGMGHMTDSHLNQKGLPAYRPAINQNCVTLAEALKPAGYTTLMSGKWHIGEERPHWPTDRGFDRFYGMLSGASSYYSVTPEANNGKDRIFANDTTKITTFDSTFYMTDAITDSALVMVDKAAGSPFFLYLAYTAPHWPLHAPNEDIEKVRGRYDGGWDSLRNERYNRLKHTGLFKKLPALSPRDPDVPAWDSLSEKDKITAIARMEVYAAMIEHLDASIGQVLAKLKEKNIDKNTLVIFLSDNGACAENGPIGADWYKNGTVPGGPNSFQSYGRGWSNASNTPFRLHKQYTHEGGITTPAIFYWQEGIEGSGRVVSSPAHIVDIMPTFCELAGVNYPANYNGNPIIPGPGLSLVPVMKSKQAAKHDFLAWEHQGSKAVLRDNWKLVMQRGGQWELFNIAKDRTELNNLVNQNPEKVAELTTLWQQWANQCGVVEYK